MEKPFKKYRVWQRAHELAVAVYVVTKTFPDDERYGLTSQMRRAAFSVPANFVEGYARGTTSQLLHFLSISRASLSELEYAIEFAKDVGVMKSEDYTRLESIRADVGRLMFRFTEAIKQKDT